MHDQKEINQILKNFSRSLYDNGHIKVKMPRRMVTQPGREYVFCSRLYTAALPFLEEHCGINARLNKISLMFDDIVIDDEEKFTIAKLTWG